MKRLYAFDLDATLIEGFIETEECAKCRGTGDFFDVACDQCNGKGRIFGEVLEYARVEVLPGRVERLRELTEAGASIAILTNQGGISLGYQTFREVQEKLLRAVYALGLSEPVIRTGRAVLQEVNLVPRNWWATFAPYHPDGKDPVGNPEDRKPNPGMIHRAMQAFRVGHSETIYVGDLASDRDAAIRADVDFAWAEDFFR